MAEAARAFDNHGRPSFLETVPASKPEPVDNDDPWSVVHQTALPPMMLDFCFGNGRILSHPYGSLDFVDLRDAGHLQLGFMGLIPTLVTIQGRHLKELRSLIVYGRVRAISEDRDRADERPDDEPAIIKIEVEKLARG